MKKLLLSIAVVLFLGMSTLQTSCMGSFKLTNNLYSWNETVGDKFVNELVFFLFLVVPIYEVTLFIDGVVLNTVEFWSGESPLAMLPGQEEIRLAEKNGVKYEIKATHNRFDIEQLEGPNKGEKCALIFDDATSTWSIEGSKGKRELMKILKNGQTVAYMPDGSTILLNSISSASAVGVGTIAMYAE